MISVEIVVDREGYTERTDRIEPRLLLLDVPNLDMSWNLDRPPAPVRRWTIRRIVCLVRVTRKIADSVRSDPIQRCVRAATISTLLPANAIMYIPF
jgi:hypothetical protein